MLLNNISFPLYAKKDDEIYQLYLEYRTNKDKIFKWFVTYVGLHGILYRNENDRVSPMLTDFLQFCKDNNILCDGKPVE